MTGQQFAIVAAIITVGGLVSVIINEALHDWYGIAGGGSCILAGLVLATLSLRDR